MSTKYRFEELSEENQERASYGFCDAKAGDGYWYELNIDGVLLSRNRQRTGAGAADNFQDAYDNAMEKIEAIRPRHMTHQDKSTGAHTLEEWSNRGHMKDYNREGTGEYYEVCAVVDEYGRRGLSHVCDVEIGVPTEACRDEAKRRADLIAKAPQLAEQNRALAEALKGMVDEWEQYWSELEERMPSDSGCIVCTAGTVPNHLNTGLCAYHKARAALSLTGATK